MRCCLRFHVISAMVTISNDCIILLMANGGRLLSWLLNPSFVSKGCAGLNSLLLNGVWNPLNKCSFIGDTSLLYLSDYHTNLFMLVSKPVRLFFHLQHFVLPFVLLKYSLISMYISNGCAVLNFFIWLMWPSKQVNAMGKIIP